MPSLKENPVSGIPPGLEKPVRKEANANLLEAVRLLLDILTPVLCEAVFKKHRITERERKWTFYKAALFWTAMIIHHPPSIQQGLGQTRRARGKDKLWPQVRASARSFFSKCAALHPRFFQSLYEAFIKQALSKAPQAYASWMSDLRERFPAIYVIDGSRLDAIAKTLKLLRPERARILPGCLTVTYDLFRGIAAQVLFFPDAAEAELPRSQESMGAIESGALLLGDRLYASVKFFHLLGMLGLWGLFRLNGTLNVKKIKTLSKKEGRGFLEDSLVEVGSGVGQPAILLRLIRCRSQGRRLYLLTSVLDPKKLAAEEVLSLYGLRWTIERMFLDLKETLDLHTLHASHPNLVAQQVYASALVHAAFRIAQARIAQKAKVLPEQISTGKLFPRLAQAASDYCAAQVFVFRTKAMNPGRHVRFPSFSILPSASAKIGSILVEHRSPARRKRRFCASGKRWKSFTHVRGGRTFLKNAAIG